MTEKRIDLDAPCLAGKMVTLDKDGTELVRPPVDCVILSGPEEVPDADKARCDASGCDRKVTVSNDSDNDQYAWYYLTNSGDTYMGVTIERRWMYQGRQWKETARYRLYPGQYREVFSFPNSQRPQCCIVACAAEPQQG